MAADRDPNQPSHGSQASHHDRTVVVDVPSQIAVYRLGRLLGRGGMGEVWLALDTKLERDVALKVMRRELLANDEAVKRFYREARAVARLNHPNIVQVYSIGEEKGLIYMVMELVEGDTVTQRLRAAGRLPIEPAVSIILQATEGLGYACSRGIIHRDIKPSNLMVTPDGHVKITDFGLAKMIQADTQVTQAGTTMGSPNYMSPEQARGEEADHRSDIYSLGISFYQILTGEPPFIADTPLSVLLKHIQEPLPEPPSLKALCGGRALEVIKRMTAKRAEDRYSQYEELARDVVALAPNVRVRPATYISTGFVAPPSQPDAPLSSALTESAAAHPTATAAPPETLRQTLPPTTTASPSETLPPAPAKTATLALAVSGAVVTLALILWTVMLFRGETGSQADAPTVDIVRRPRAPRANQPSATLAPTPASETMASPAPATPAPPAAPAEPSAPAPAPTPIVIVLTPLPVTTPAPPTPPPGGVSVISPPDSPALATPAVTAPPTLTPAADRSHLVLGRSGASGLPVQLTDMVGNPVESLPAGTVFPDYRLVENPTRYVVRHRGAERYVAYADARVVIRPGYETQSSTATGPNAIFSLIIGTATGGPDEQIRVDANPQLTRQLFRLPAGTEVTVLEELPTTYKILTSDNRTGYIPKTAARRKP